MIDNDAAIVTDATDNNPNDGSMDAAVADLLKWEEADAETLSDPEEEDETDEHDALEADESDGNETSEDEDEHVDDDGESEAVEDEDERIIKHKVDGKDVEFKVKDAKRLYGREVLISKREVEIADERKVVAESHDLLRIVAKKMTERAEERFKPYAGINWIVEAQEWGPETTKHVQQLANAAYQDIEFYKGELAELEKLETAEKAKAFEAQKSAFLDQRKTMIRELEKEKPGVDLDKWHRDLRSHVVSRGISEAAFNALNDKAALLLVEDAMKYRKGLKAETKKVNKAPTNVIKTSKNPEAVRNSVKNRQDKDALNRLKMTGSMDDATAYFLSRFK